MPLSADAEGKNVFIIGYPIYPRQFKNKKLQHHNLLGDIERSEEQASIKIARNQIAWIWEPDEDETARDGGAGSESARQQEEVDSDMEGGEDEEGEEDVEKGLDEDELAMAEMPILRFKEQDMDELLNDYSFHQYFV